MLKTKINSICKIESFDIIWSFDPFRFQNLKIFKSRLSIYHAVDVHHSKLEKEAVKTADLVFGSSRLILDRLKGNRNCFKINHGLASYFIDYKYKFESKRNIIKVGYVGNLHYKYLDTKTLSTIINNHPNVEFHFIGPYSTGNLSDKRYHKDFITFLIRNENVILYGPVPSQELPRYLFKFDILLLCYTGDYQKAALSNPHKILEYLSTGKVIISHYIDEYKDKKALIEMAYLNQEIPKIFKNVLDNLGVYNQKDLQIKRRKFAKDHLYENKIKDIEEIIKSL
jgi:hypothetical protein